jgi:hypothetical protein
MGDGARRETRWAQYGDGDVLVGQSSMAAGRDPMAVSRESPAFVAGQQP